MLKPRFKLVTSSLMIDAYTSTGVFGGIQYVQFHIEFCNNNRSVTREFTMRRAITADLSDKNFVEF